MKKMQGIITLICAICTLGVAVNVSAAEIGNTVWNDRNANGVQDAGEEGIAGVRVKLYNGNDVETDKTNSKGRYGFEDLDAGHYTLIVAQETLPEGCYATYDRDGKKDGKYSDKYLREGDDFTHADFGYNCTKKDYAVAGTYAPRTGVGSAAGIIALALASGTGLFFYKRNTLTDHTKK